MTERPIAMSVSSADTGVSVRLACLTLFGCALAAALWLSLSDHLPPPLTRAVQGRQDLAHVALHMCLTAVALLAFPSRKSRTVGSMLAFAVAVELSQAATLTRQVSVEDLGANLLGVLVGAGLLVALLGLAGAVRGADTARHDQ